MIISVAIGYGLSEMKKASKIAQNESILYKSSMVLEDILSILENSTDINSLLDDNASADLYSFFEMTQYLPLDIANEKVVLSLKSARSKLNINMINQKNELLFRNYFDRYMIGNNYVDILKECMRKNQAKDQYNNSFSSLFDKKPALFRNYIASKEHLEQINEFYTQEYGETNLKMVPFDTLFSFSEDPNEAVDLNYISSDVWELILDTSKERAQELYAGEGTYTSLGDLHLTQKEKKNLAKFKTTFFAPFIFVEIEIMREGSRSKLTFVYDIKKKRGYNFVFEV